MPIKCDDFKNIDLKEERTVPYVSKFILRRMVDEHPDLFYLKQFENYKGDDLTPKEAAKYAEQDRKELASYGESWYMIGIRAECSFIIPTGKTGVIQKLTSSGEWGIHSESGEDEFKRVEDEQLDELKDYLGKLGIQYSGDTPLDRWDH